MRFLTRHLRPIVLALLLGVCAGLVGVLFVKFRHYDPSDWIWDEDIFSIWTESNRVAEGENPYARIAGSDMRSNWKYATYFPLFYETGALTQLMGARDFHTWLRLWRIIFAVFHVAIAILLLRVIDGRFRQPLLGVLGALLWLFNRWTLEVAHVGAVRSTPCSVSAACRRGRSCSR